MTCEQYVNTNLEHMIDTIRQTETDDHERAFGFSTSEAGPIVLGDCDDVDRPNIPNQIGTFHTHTIYNSRLSPDDYEIFQSSRDRLMCYGRPMEGFWDIRCYDKDLSVCGEKEVK